MGDPTRYPAGDAGPDDDSPTGIPRWMRLAAIIVAIVVLLGVVVVLAGGPGGHTPPDGIH